MFIDFGYFFSFYFFINISMMEGGGAMGGREAFQFMCVYARKIISAATVYGFCCF